MKRAGFAGILAAIFVFVFPFINSHKIFYAPMNAKVFYIFGATAIIGILFAYKTYKGDLLPTFRKSFPVFLSLCFTSGVFLLSGVLGINPTMSFFGDIIRGTSILFVISLALEAWMLSYLLKKNDWHKVGIAIITSSCFYSLITLFDNLLFPGGKTGIAAPGFLFGNSTFAGTFICIGIILSLVAISECKKSYRTWFGLLIILQLLHPTILNPEIIAGNVSFLDIINHPVSLEIIK